MVLKKKLKKPETMVFHTKLAMTHNKGQYFTILNIIYSITS